MDRDSDSDWEETEEDSLLTSATDCLFCTCKCAGVLAVFHHCREAHNFDLEALALRLSMDEYGYIKLINYIRKNKPDPSQLNELGTDELWDSDTYLKPVVMDDPYLFYDFIGELSDKKPVILPEGGETLNYVNSEDGAVTMSQEHFAELKLKIKSLTDELKRKDEIMQHMKSTFCMDEMEENANSLRSPDQDKDLNYFDTYNSVYIHWKMLKDTVRTLSFQNAIYGNKTIFTSKKVLDLGCGTGILSFMAAKAGASKVFACDDSTMIYQAMGNASENGMLTDITFLKGKIEEVSFPEETQVDIIISECMGYFVLYEGMLDSLYAARTKYLKPDGIVLPSRISMYLVGASDNEMHTARIKFWENVYGFKMNSVKELFLGEVGIEFVKSDKIVTREFMIKEFDLQKFTLEDTSFKSRFELIGNKFVLCNVTHLVGYFNTYFDLPHNVLFSTGPLSSPTHWKQTTFWFDEPLQLEQDEIIEGFITCRKSHHNPRGLFISIEICGKTYTYCLN